MLRELSRNLLHNAIRHVPPNGRLQVRVARENGSVLLAVEDSGPGLSADMQARLFEPFSPGDPRRGSGLGLTICHEIVNTLGGTISLKNRMAGEKVQGLDVAVRLPLAQE
jgi:two-component system sensor histidine kinase TctE